MIPVTPSAIRHLLVVAEQEHRRLMAVHEAVGDDWPPEFDANDIPLCDIAIESLMSTIQNGGSVSDLAGKPLHFLLALVPGYVNRMRDDLTTDDYEALKLIYSYQSASRVIPFPE